MRLYRAQGVRLLKEHGEFVPDHPKPVATTWSLFFEKVEQANAAAAELLRFCAFLAPDAIPEELFAESAAELGSMLEPVASDLSSFNAAIKELLKYSLVHRDPETKTLSIHRLVQEVLKDQMDEETRRLWAERAVRAVSRVFPYPEFTKWDRCRRYLLHAQVCSAHINEWNLLFTEAARLLNYLGAYHWYRGEYEQVESLHQRALTIQEQALGPEHANTASSLNELALFYKSQGKYEQAEPLIQRALAIRERVLGLDHPDTAASLYWLAYIYSRKDEYEQSEAFYRRTLKIYEKTLPSDHPNIAGALNNYASLLRKMNRIVEASKLEQRAMEIRAMRSS